MQNVLGAHQDEQSIADEVRALFPRAPTTSTISTAARGCSSSMSRRVPDFDGQKGSQTTSTASVRAVTNLNFFIDDEDHAHELLTAMGAQDPHRGAKRRVKVPGRLRPDNTPRRRQAQVPLHGTRHLIGLDLEIMEPNFNTFIKQTVQQPCFCTIRAQERRQSPAHRLRLVVPNLEQAIRKFGKDFPARLPQQFLQLPGRVPGRALPHRLRGIELEYCQPLTKQGQLAEQLGARGAWMVAVEFGARDAAQSSKTAQAAPTHPKRRRTNSASPGGPRRTGDASRDPVGSTSSSSRASTYSTAATPRGPALEQSDEKGQDMTPEQAEGNAPGNSCRPSIRAMSRHWRN